MLSKFLRAAAGAGRVPTETITYISNYNSNSTTSTSFTFSDVNFGTAFTNRRIVLVIGNVVVGSNNGLISSVIIDGVTATQLVRATIVTSNTIELAIYIATVPNSTSGDVQINVNAGGTSGNRIIQVYALDSLKTATATGTDANAPFRFTRTFNNGEIYIGGGRCVPTATETWDNATEQITTTQTGVNRISSATYFPATAGEREISFSPSTNTGALMTSVVFI